MITTKAIVEMLEFMSKSDMFEDYYNTFSVAGDPNDIGWFKSFGEGTPVAYNARIKSGTIGRVKSHSGYIKDKSGRLIAFSFIANNLSISGSSMTKIHEELLKAISNLD